MKNLLVLLSVLLIQPSFREDQKKHARVKAAYSAKYEAIKKALDARGIPAGKLNICLVGYKEEQVLELWVRKGTEGKYSLYGTYPVCASSGTIGPKRRAGDGQVPEGFYHIDRYNPYSNFHLSLGVSYPNASDRILGTRGSLGGDIFIHGSCVTIGCMPLTDDLIKEVYVLAVEARTSGQTRIPCLIFPMRMDAKGMKKLEEYSVANPVLQKFWKNLEEGYALFVKNSRPPEYTVKKDGQYQFSSD
ncbi:MAG: L,D-transpeptidase family protein [Bacteroidia bacterium]|nr:L,D-transpeptidase family protein [Bacteroidia bacterium]